MCKSRSSGFIRLQGFVPLVLSCISITGCLIGSEVRAQTDVNTSQNAGPEIECAIAKNPSDSSQLFSACVTGGAGLFAARSVDGGDTWTYPDPEDKTIADGDPNQGPLACCDPTLAWDSFGNLYVGYLGYPNVPEDAVILISTDAGLSFNHLVTFPGSVDQPTVSAEDTPDAEAPVAVWLVWNQDGSMHASGAAVTGTGMIGAFSVPEDIAGTHHCSFGDVAIAPTGVVVQACQRLDGAQFFGPASIVINTDMDGLGPGNFGGAVAATTTNVAMYDQIPPQMLRSIDAEAGLAYDRFPGSSHFGRLYLVYTDETELENNDTDIMLRFSDDDGATWSAPPIRVNDDPADPIRSQFLPRIASDPQSGNVLVCWHDARNSASNTAMQEYCSIAYPNGANPVFSANVAIGDAPSTSLQVGMEFGDYSGLVYSDATAHPVWADTSNSTGDNPDNTSEFDAYTDRVSDGQLSCECETCPTVPIFIWIIIIIIVIFVTIFIIRWLIILRILKW